MRMNCYTALQPIGPGADSWTVRGATGTLGLPDRLGGPLPHQAQARIAALHRGATAAMIRASRKRRLSSMSLDFGHVSREESVAGGCLQRAQLPSARQRHQWFWPPHTCGWFGSICMCYTYFRRHACEGWRAQDQPPHGPHSEPRGRKQGAAHSRSKDASRTYKRAHGRVEGRRAGKVGRSGGWARNWLSRQCHCS